MFEVRGMNMASSVQYDKTFIYWKYRDSSVNFVSSITFPLDIVGL